MNSCNRAAATELQQSCNRAQTRLWQSCTPSSAPRAACNSCNRARTAATELQQSCTRAATEHKLACGSLVRQEARRAQQLLAVVAREDRVRCSRRHSMRQHTSAYVSIRQQLLAVVAREDRVRCSRRHKSSIRQHTSAYVSIRQHTSEYVSIRQHTSEYVSIRQHTSASGALWPEAQAQGESVQQQHRRESAAAA
jgi:hypothetical protein